jgi:hypothetical protein
MLQGVKVILFAFTLTAFAPFIDLLQITETLWDFHYVEYSLVGCYAM